MVEPRFCETLQCFHHILGDMALPEGTKKQKSKPSEISVNFGYDKNRPNTDFPIFYVHFLHHFCEHFSINSSVGFRHSKMQKNPSTLAFPLTLPRTHHRRGGNQEATRMHPGDTQEASRSRGSFKRHLTHKSSPLSHQMQKVHQNHNFTRCF